MIAGVFNHRVVRFLVVGSVNTLFSYAVYAGFLFGGLSYVYANFLALVAGIIFSFRTQGAFVFGNRNKSLFGRFVLCWTLIYLANIFLINEMMQLGFTAYVSGAMAIPLITVISYYAQKRFVFATPKSQAQTMNENVHMRGNLPLAETSTPVKLVVVVPCFNEEEVLPETSKRLVALLEKLTGVQLVTADSSICFVDDGSKDRTWNLIESLASTDSRIHGIKLSRNRGHQQALLAGLFSAQGDAVVSLDADLQDDIDAIEDMIVEFKRGVEIVYGVRRARVSDTAFKRGTAQVYYSLLRRLGVEIVPNHADYRLMGRHALDALREFSEVNLFLRGVIPLLGFKTSTVYYDRAERFAGVSKYPLRRMLSFAIDGVTSFSVTPLRAISLLGLVICLLSVGMVAWVLYGHFFLDTTIPGWASSVLPIYFLGGIQLLSIGVVGEYVAKIYLETKRRPRFFIERVI